MVFSRAAAACAALLAARGFLASGFLASSPASSRTSKPLQAEDTDDSAAAAAVESAAPSGSVPLRLRLKLAQAEVSRSSQARERESAEAALRRLELENPDMALLTVLAGRAADAADGSHAQWKWARLAEEIERVHDAAAVSALGLDEDAPAAEDAADEDEDAPAGEAWRARARALSELQYWTLRGNRKAEAALLLAVRRHCDNWLGETADELLRQAWGMHADAAVNGLMARAKAALRAGDAPGAIEAFDAAAARAAAVDDGRCFAEAHRWAGLTFERALGERGAARRAFEAALAASPNNYVVLLDLARLAAAEADEGAPPRAASAPRPRDERRAAADEYLDRAQRLNPALRADARTP
ncbi:hypothetical protein M885DRAFT_514747 [Pelagophyceae sp. CCMP2097]|nr:hypothetical protein M885DRAFT_514747 [Pelagophyceae sp. CCMP2097]